MQTCRRASTVTRVLHLTDLHLSRLFPASWARAVVERSNALDADLIAISGDLINGSIEMRRADVEPLRALRARDGIWVVSGNHEEIFGYEAWMLHYADMGMHVLANAHVVLRRGDGELILAGVNDRSAPAKSHRDPDLDAALAGAPSGTPIVLLDHQPRDAPRAAARGVALQLSGHTHGRHDPRARSTGRARKRRVRLGRIRGGRHDALRQQRDCALAWVRAPTWSSKRADPLHPSSSWRRPAMRLIAIEEHILQPDVGYDLLYDRRGRYRAWNTHRGLQNAAAVTHSIKTL